MKTELSDHYESISGSHAAEKIRSLANSARYCLFGTDLRHPPITVRPMTVQSVDDAGYLWFLSGRTTHTNQQIAADPQVQLFFANPASSEFLTLEGRAHQRRLRTAEKTLDTDRENLVQRRRR